MSYRCLWKRWGPKTALIWPDPGATGLFFNDQTPESLKAAVKLFENHEDDFKPQACHRNAERLGQERFQRELRATLEEL